VLKHNERAARLPDITVPDPHRPGRDYARVEWRPSLPVVDALIAEFAGFEQE